MYTGYQEELFKSEWGVNPGFKALADKLNELIPAQGSVDNPRSTNKALEKFRKAQNVIYDLFNNGLMNKGKSLKVLGLQKQDLPLPNEWYAGNWDRMEEIVEIPFSQIIQKAAKEQGVA